MLDVLGTPRRAEKTLRLPARGKSSRGNGQRSVRFRLRRQSRSNREALIPCWLGCGADELKAEGQYLQVRIIAGHRLERTTPQHHMSMLGTPPPSRCIKSAQTHRARVSSLLTRASDTTLRLTLGLVVTKGRKFLWLSVRNRCNIFDALKNSQCCL